MTEAALPSHLAAELAEYDRGALDDDFDRRMNFLSDLIVQGGIPYRLENAIQIAVGAGNLSPSGDRLRYGSEYDAAPDGVYYGGGAPID